MPAGIEPPNVMLGIGRSAHQATLSQATSGIRRVAGSGIHRHCNSSKLCSYAPVEGLKTHTHASIYRRLHICKVVDGLVSWPRKIRRTHVHE